MSKLFSSFFISQKMMIRNICKWRIYFLSFGLGVIIIINRHLQMSNVKLFYIFFLFHNDDDDMIDFHNDDSIQLIKTKSSYSDDDDLVICQSKWFLFKKIYPDLIDAVSVLILFYFFCRNYQVKQTNKKKIGWIYQLLDLKKLLLLLLTLSKNTFFLSFIHFSFQ